MATYQTERRWIVKVRRTDEDDWPDIQRQYSRSTFRPDTLIVTVACPEGGECRIDEVSAACPRVLKAGLSDIDRYSEQWSRNQRPDWWLANLAAEVLERVSKGADR